MGRKSSRNVTDDPLLVLGNAQLDCVHTTQSQSRCIRHRTILINGEIWSWNYLVPPAMLIKWTGSSPDLHFPPWDVGVTFWVRQFERQDWSRDAAATRREGKAAQSQWGGRSYMRTAHRRGPGLRSLLGHQIRSEGPILFVNFLGMDGSVRGTALMLLVWDEGTGCPHRVEPAVENCHLPWRLTAAKDECREDWPLLLSYSLDQCSFLIWQTILSALRSFHWAILFFLFLSFLSLECLCLSICVGHCRL